MDIKDTENKEINFDKDLETLDKIIKKTENETEVEKMIDNHKKGNDILNNLKDILSSAENKFNEFEEKLNKNEIPIKNNENFFNNINKLEKIVKQMEQTNKASGNNFKEYIDSCEQGLKIIRHLEDKLKKAEEKIDKKENIINVDE